MIKEIWSDVVITDGSLNKDYYKGLYKISNMGKIKSLSRIDSIGRNIKGKFLKLVKDNNGYEVVTLSKNGKAKTHKFHRLLAMAFIANPDNKPYIDHIDTNRTNNNLDNLRWVTQEENSNNEISLQHYKKASIKNSKLIPLV